MRTASYQHFIRAVLMRILPVAFAFALVLAGCEPPAKEPDPDTTPKFSGSVASQTYKEMASIEPLTLPRARGGNGSLSYSLGPELPDGLRFDRSTRRLTGTPQLADARPATYDHDLPGGRLGRQQVLQRRRHAAVLRSRFCR